jgi:hypothetical protein
MGVTVSQLKRVHTAFFLVLVLFSFSALASVAMNGAGSTFINPVFKQWVSAYAKIAPDANFTYQSIGSLQGVDRLLSHDIDFAASDALLHLEQLFGGSISEGSSIAACWERKLWATGARKSPNVSIFSLLRYFII